MVEPELRLPVQDRAPCEVLPDVGVTAQQVVGRAQPSRLVVAAEDQLVEQAHAWPDRLPAHRWGAPRTAYTRVRPEPVGQLALRGVVERADVIPLGAVEPVGVHGSGGLAGA